MGFALFFVILLGLYFLISWIMASLEIDSQKSISNNFIKKYENEKK